MTRLKYLDPADGQYKLLPVGGGGGGGGAEEVVISAGVAPALNEELWVDTSATVPVYDWSYADNRYLSSGFRNVIRNGDFSIAQRGNGPFTAVGVYTMDGWLASNTGGTLSVSRIPAVAGDASPRAALTVSGQSATSDYAQILAVIEDVNTLNGKTVTISFDAWSNSGTPKIGVELQQLFGTGGTPSANQNLPVSAVTLSTTRTRYSLTFALPSVAGASLGTNNNHCLRLALWVSAGSAWATRASNIGIQSGTFNIADVQLEAGSVATVFERLPVQQQLAWCQRYYQRHIDPPLRGVTTSATALDRMGMLFPVVMRAAPSFGFNGTFAAAEGTYSAVIGSFSTNYTNATKIEMNMISSGFTANRPAVMYSYNGTGLMEFSAEF